MAQYDAGILQGYANALYRRANSIIAAYTLFGIVIGLVAGFFATEQIKDISKEIAIGGGAFLFAVVGFVIGSGRAFMLKLRAQEVLCQRQIEANTHSANS